MITTPEVAIREQLVIELIRDPDPFIPDPHFFDWQPEGDKFGNPIAKEAVAARVGQFFNKERTSLTISTNHIRFAGQIFKVSTEAVVVRLVRAEYTRYAPVGSLEAPRPIRGWGLSESRSDGQPWGVEVTEFDMGNGQKLDLFTLGFDSGNLMLGRKVLGFRSFIGGNRYPSATQKIAHTLGI